ncbi:MAG: N-acetylmuramoyl-L-alanine amidase [Oscillospiraceae bacterium]|nr:N-acetylmuramoyl-L-alanine amidase [Oscillospiraceae bacterium]
MKIQEMFLTANPFSRPGIKLQKVTKIAVHYVGNPKSTALNNRNYFESLKDRKDRYVSSHFIVGLEGEIIQCIPLNEWSYCTNQANGYSISIETCHPDTTGKFNDATEKSLAWLTAYLLDRFGLTVNDIIRHYDVTGKQCPLYYVTSSAAYSRFKGMVAAELAKLRGGEASVLQNEFDTVNTQRLYYVQVGAFSVRGNAESFLLEVKKKYGDAFIKPYNNMLYVQVGAFGIKRNALNFLDSVKKDYTDSFIKEF